MFIFHHWIKNKQQCPKNSFTSEVELVTQHVAVAASSDVLSDSINISNLRD